MTPASPSWADIERFLGIDGWRRIPAGERGGRRQAHVFFEKLLPDSPGRFGTILREQLEVLTGPRSSVHPV